jgi:hypothetical protein
MDVGNTTGVKINKIISDKSNIIGLYQRYALEGGHGISQSEQIKLSVWVRKDFGDVFRMEIMIFYRPIFFFLWKLMAKFRRMENHRRSKYLMETVVVQLPEGIYTTRNTIIKTISPYKPHQ